MKEKIKSILIVLLLAAMTLAVPAPNALMEEKAAYAPLPIDLSKGPQPKEENFGADGQSYKDDSIEVKSYWDRAYNTDYLVLQVKLSHPSQLRVAPANGRSFKKNNEVVGATIAKRNNAVLAINGDFFVSTDYGYAVRQGKVLRKRPNGADVLIIDQNGDFHTIIAPKRFSDITPHLEEFEKSGIQVQNAFSFGPTLIKDNSILIRDGEKKKYQYIEGGYFSTGAQKLAQRISFSQVGELEYLIISTCGPDNKGSKGLTMVQIAELTHEIANKLYPESGAKISYNLDGGSSNTVVMKGKKINSPGSKIRQIGDIIYFATLVP